MNRYIFECHRFGGKTGHGVVFSDARNRIRTSSSRWTRKLKSKRGTKPLSWFGGMPGGVADDVDGSACHPTEIHQKLNGTLPTDP